MTMNIHTSQSQASSSVAGVSVTTGGVAAPTTTADSSASSLVPSPNPVDLTGDLAAEIAALAVKSGQQQQSIDTKSAETQDALEDQQAAAEVATMHQEASATRTGAWESGLMQVGAGAATMAGAGASIGATPGSTAAGASGILKGLGDGLNGGATITGGLSKAAATDLEASAAAQKTASDDAARAGSVDRDDQKSAQTFVQAAIDFFREYQSTKAQVAAAALHSA